MDIEEAVNLPELDNVMPGLGPLSGVEHVEAPVPSVREDVPLLFSKPPRRRWCGGRRRGGGGGGQIQQKSHGNKRTSLQNLDASYPMSQ